MTENEIILEKQIADDLSAVLKEAKEMGCKEVAYFRHIPLQNVETVIKALEEIQQYRAIGTVEELQALRNASELWEHNNNLAYKQGRIDAIDEFAEEIAFGIYESVIWDMLATMSKNSSLSDTSDKIVDYVINTANEIAERLKAGEKNE